MPEANAKTQITSFTPWQALETAIGIMGCKECEHLHGHACSGGKYPRLILLMDQCPRN